MFFSLFSRHLIVYLLTSLEFCIIYKSSYFWFLIFSIAIFLLSRSYTFSIGIKPELSGQGKIFAFFFFKNAVTNLDLWQGAETCMELHSNWSGNHSLMWGISFVSKIFTHWSYFTVSSTIFRLSVPFASRTDYTIIFRGCFTVSEIHSV